jgi:hypothetical protein
MQNPMSLELQARELMNSRLQEAARDALADALPQSSVLPPTVAARQLLASGLRALAARLDPCVVGESSLVGATSR